MRPTILLLLLVFMTGTLAAAQDDGYSIVFRSGEILDIEGIGPMTLYQLNPTTGDSRPVPNVPEGSVSEVSWSADGSQLAFAVSTEVGFGAQPGPLYVMNADGSDLRTLTDGVQVVSGVSWSPDGTSIAYNSFEHSEALSGSINVVSAADGAVLNSIEGAAFELSPDGSQIAFLRQQPGSNFRYDLYVADTLDGEAVQLTDGGDVELFAWHPSGEEITYVYYELPNNDRVGDLYAINPDTGTQRNVTNTGTIVTTFAWSPDGTWLAFSDERGDFYLLNPEGDVNLVADNPLDGYRAFPPLWSPDGTQIIFEFPSSESTLGYTLWTLHGVDTATFTVRDLSPNLDTEGHYSWSPDSTQVVFMGKLNADIEIYNVPPDGSAAPRALTSRPGYYDTSPVWQPVSD